MMSVWIAVRPERCSGCRTCEVACSFAHYRKFGSSLARVRVSKLEEVGVDCPVLCRQCPDSPCVEVCPTGALVRTPSGAVVLDEEACLKCEACAEACPYGACTLHPEAGYPLICDLCGGDPACVRECPTAALTCEEGVEVLMEGVDRNGCRECGQGGAPLPVRLQRRRDAFSRQLAQPSLAKWGIR